MSDPHFERFLARYRLQPVDRLGDGKDGIVIQTDRPSAVKGFYDDELYRRELRMYRALAGNQIDRIGEFQIPRLLGWDDADRLIEMSIVSAPYILDFAASYDELELMHLGFTDEVWAEREQHWAEIFGDDWPVVRDARDELVRLTNLMILDLTPNNIRIR